MILLHRPTLAFAAAIACILAVGCDRSGPPDSPSTTSTVKTPDENPNVEADETPTGESKQQASLDTSLIAETFCGAVVLSPKDILESGSLPAELFTPLLANLDLTFIQALPFANHSRLWSLFPNFA